MFVTMVVRAAASLVCMCYARVLNGVWTSFVFVQCLDCLRMWIVVCQLNQCVLVCVCARVYEYSCVGVH